MEENKEYYVYVLLNPFKPGKFIYEGIDYEFDYEPYYVGRGKYRNYGKERVYDHVYKRNSKYETNHGKANLIKKIIDSDKDFKYILLHEKINLKIADKLEIKTISKIGRRYINEGSLLNATPGGDGITGYNPKIHEWSDERREKWANQVSGDGNPFYGKKHSKESLKKMSENCSTKREEVKEKLRKPKTFKNGINPKKGIGRPDLTEESLNSIKEKLYVPIIQKSLDGNFIKKWKSAQHIYEELGFKPNAINNCLRGRTKSSGGFIWEYA